MRQLDAGKQLVFENRELQETVADLKEQLAQQKQQQIPVVEQPTKDDSLTTELEQMVERQE